MQAADVSISPSPSTTSPFLLVPSNVDAVTCMKQSERFKDVRMCMNIHAYNVIRRFAAGDVTEYTVLYRSTKQEIHFTRRV